MYLFAKEDGTDVGECGEEAWEGSVNVSGRKRMNWDVVDFDSKGEVTDT